jgi:hypothetical protein
VVGGGRPEIGVAAQLEIAPPDADDRSRGAAWGFGGKRLLGLRLRVRK